MSYALQPHGLQHARLPCPSLSSRVCLDSCPLSQWCYLTILSSATPFFCLQSFPASESFPMSQLFAWRGQSTGALASASVLPMNTQVWFPLGLTGLISLHILCHIHFFWPCHAACRVFISPPWTEPRPWAVKVQSSNHWTAREFPQIQFLKFLPLFGMIPAQPLSIREDNYIDQTTKIFSPHPIHIHWLYQSLSPPPQLCTSLNLIHCSQWILYVTALLEGVSSFIGE